MALICLWNRRGRRLRRSGAPREFAAQALEKAQPSRGAHRAPLSCHRAVVVPALPRSPATPTPEPDITA